MLKQKTVYFREEDLPLWKNVSNKAQFLHDALTTGMTVVPPRDVPNGFISKIDPRFVDGPDEEDVVENDPLANMVWEERTHTLIDESTGEVLESDAETIKELK